MKNIQDKLKRQRGYLDRVLDFLSSSEKDKIPFLVYNEGDHVLKTIFGFNDSFILEGRIEEFADDYFYLPYNGKVFVFFYYITNNNVIIYSTIYCLGWYDIYGKLDSNWIEEVLHIHAKLLPKKLINKINNELSFFMTCDACDEQGGLCIKKHKRNQDSLRLLIEKHNSAIEATFYRIKYCN